MLTVTMAMLTCRVSSVLYGLRSPVLTSAKLMMGKDKSPEANLSEQEGDHIC